MEHIKIVKLLLSFMYIDIHGERRAIEEYDEIWLDHLPTHNFKGVADLDTWTVYTTKETLRTNTRSTVCLKVQTSTYSISRRTTQTATM